MSSLMNDTEMIVCAIHGYGRVEDLASLNEEQKASLPKSKLPSEDMVWYLLFFARDRISRIYLIDSSRLVGGVEDGRPGCVTREDYFEVIGEQHSNEKNHFDLHLMRERRKQ